MKIEFSLDTDDATIREALLANFHKTTPLYVTCREDEREYRVLQVGIHHVWLRTLNGRRAFPLSCVARIWA